MTVEEAENLNPRFAKKVLEQGWTLKAVRDAEAYEAAEQTRMFSLKKLRWPNNPEKWN